MGAKDMAATIKELSQYCGLSISTVSKALNGYADISEKTRAAVLRAAEEIGYHPSAIARALKTNRTYNIGVLFVDENESGLTHHYFSAVLDSFKREAERRGYDITFINHNIGRTQMTYLEHSRYRNVDGLCLACVDFYSPEVVELSRSDLPLVTIDHPFMGHTCVQSQNEAGMRELVRYVYGKGHRRIAFVHGGRSTVTDLRISGFYTSMGELGLEVFAPYIAGCSYCNPSSAYVEVKRLLRLSTPPTCILMSDDYAALGALQAAEETGLRVPEDLSVAGYDGIQLTQLLRPRLTTLRQDTERIGCEAAARLVDRIEQPEAFCPPFVFVPGELIEGQTVADIAGA